jgi:two-component system chemotaxis sensor kinase CheA
MVPVGDAADPRRGPATARHHLRRRSDDRTRGRCDRRHRRGDARCRDGRRGRGGVIGSAMIRGRATDIIDLAHYLPMNDPGWLHSPAQRAADREPRADPAGRAFRLPARNAEPGAEGLGPPRRAGRGFRQRQRLAPMADERRADRPRPRPRRRLRLCRTLRAGARRATSLRILGLTVAGDTRASHARRTGRLDEIVAKFDRRALLSELAERRPDMRHAA